MSIFTYLKYPLIQITCWLDSYSSFANCSKGDNNIIPKEFVPNASTNKNTPSKKAFLKRVLLSSICLSLFVTFYLIFRAKYFSILQTLIVFFLSILIFLAVSFSKNTPVLNKIIPWTGIILGTIIFLSIFNISLLNPNYVDWLLQGNLGDGDIKHYYYGWLAYRQEGLQFPIGKIVSIGYPQTSVVFTDSIPLLAIILKPFNKILPTPFQYFGIWILTCYILMGHFSFKLLKLYSTKMNFLIPSSLFFILSPILAQRYLCGHLALLAHFLIIASFYLFLKKKEKKDILYWTLLISTALLIHLYLYVMVFIVFIFYFISQLKKNNILKMSIILTPIIFLQILIMFFSGYFIGIGQASISSGINEFGTCANDINSLFNPLYYSRFFNSFPIFSSNSEVFNYLGISVLLGLAITLIISLRKRILQKIFYKKFHLALAVVLLAIFSLSNQIRFNNNLILEYEIPSFLIILTQFAASARFLWPLYYLIIIFIFYTFSKVKTPNIQNLVCIFLIIFLILHIYELSSIFNEVSKLTSVKHKYKNILEDPIWQFVAKTNSELALINININTPIHKEFTIIAIENNLKISDVRLSRTTKEQEENILNRQKEFFAGNLQEGVVYVCKEDAFKIAKPRFENISYNYFVVKEFFLVYLIS
ncbi:MAG TPA: DUF6311 domain-containing protein [Candidatus Woesearchaeota archaeon]|nr:DUF6311 domain-containing protein [Candidatus Woesearchaeota archaeon]